jgi:hypothetical protein
LNNEVSYYTVKSERIPIPALCHSYKAVFVARRFIIKPKENFAMAGVNLSHAVTLP